MSTLLPWLRMEPSPGAGRPPWKVVGEPTLAAVEELAAAAGLPAAGLAAPTAAAAAAAAESSCMYVVRCVHQSNYENLRGSFIHQTQEL